TDHFLFNAPAPTEIYTLSLHDALPICFVPRVAVTWCSSATKSPFPESDVDTAANVPPDSSAIRCMRANTFARPRTAELSGGTFRSEEHTSELQSQSNLVCRLLLEKKKK